MGSVIAVAAGALAGALTVALLALVRRNRELRQRLRAAVQAAQTDCLTGLANRAGLRYHLHRLLAGARADDVVAAVALDLDGLKIVNDRHGHPVGDQVVAAVARRITATTARTGCPARLGGDEFVVLLDRYSDADLARRDANRLAGRLTETIGHVGLADHPDVTITASVGVAVRPADDADDLLAAADAAMYRAKRARHGRHSAPDIRVPTQLPRHRRRDPSESDPAPVTERSTGHAGYDKSTYDGSLPAA